MLEKNLYTLLETSKIVRVSLSTIRRWSASGKLPTVHFSKRNVKVTRAVIEDMEKNGLPDLDKRRGLPC